MLPAANAVLYQIEALILLHPKVGPSFSPAKKPEALTHCFGPGTGEGLPGEGLPRTAWAVTPDAPVRAESQATGVP